MEKLTEDFQTVEVRDERYPNYMLEWEYIGEGFEGDYDPDHGADEPLLRFTLYKRAEDMGAVEWEQVDECSYCTDNNTETPREHLEKMGVRIIETLAPLVDAGEGYRGAAAALSWIDPYDEV